MSKLRKWTIEDFQQIAKAKGGECLSESYKNPLTALRMRCGEQHEWDAWPQNLTKGYWCKKCAKRGAVQRFSMDDVRVIAASKGLECLSLRYTDLRSPMVWKCLKCGTEFSRSLAWVRYKGRECPGCRKPSNSYQHPVLPPAEKLQAELRELVQARGGIIDFGAVGYLGATKRRAYSITGDCGHEWMARTDHIREGRWCPQCTMKGERETRLTFENLTGRKFPKTRSALGCQLELDGFCDEIGVAFEYQGIRHYEVIPNLPGSSAEALADQQKRDIRKKELCDEKWITLIEIPWVMSREDRADFIRRELENLGVLLTP